jgi:membrane protein DedA with SNARE-associated domain
MKEIFLPILEWYMGHINYGTICLLMVVESSFIPFPSEIVVPPAAWKVAQGELNMALVLLSATVGALLGAVINYTLAFTLGRAFIHRFAQTRLAKLLLISPEGVDKAEAFFLKHGALSTFTGRLIPGVRQLISLPAGIARMRMSPFILYTALGAFIWNVVLALLGYFLYSQKDLLDKYFHQITYAGLFLFVVVVVYLVAKAVRNKKEPVKTA